MKSTTAAGKTRSERFLSTPDAPVRASDSIETADASPPPLGFYVLVPHNSNNPLTVKGPIRLWDWLDFERIARSLEGSCGFVLLRSADFTDCDRTMRSPEHATGRPSCISLTST
jgi:hypothetical protein